jgi:uncharacterized membrane protein HdeD (DUF308 family)
MFDLLTRNWWMLLVRGLLAILFGVLAFAWPGLTLATLVLLFGAYALIDGIFLVVGAIAAWGERDDHWLLLIIGLVGIGVGVMTFRAPQLTAVGLLLYIAVWSLATGVLNVVAAIRLRKEMTGELWLALAGVASIIFSVILLWNPLAGALSLLWVIGAYAIVMGALLIVLGFEVRGVRRRMKPATA